MGIVFSLLLIVMGVLAAGVFIEVKFPATVRYIVKLREYQEGLGLLSLAVGLYGLIEWLSMLRFYGTSPFYMILSLAASLLFIVLGLIFGLDIIRRNLKDPNLPALVKLGSLRTRLLVNQQTLGFAALIVGALLLLLRL